MQTHGTRLPPPCCWMLIKRIILNSQPLVKKPVKILHVFNSTCPIVSKNRALLGRENILPPLNANWIPDELSEVVNLKLEMAENIDEPVMRKFVHRVFRKSDDIGWVVAFAFMSTHGTLIYFQSNGSLVIWGLSWCEMCCENSDMQPFLRSTLPRITWAMLVEKCQCSQKYISVNSSLCLQVSASAEWADQLSNIKRSQM